MSFKKKKKDLYEIELNTGDKYSLYDDVILRYELLINRKVDKKTFDKLLQDNTLLDAYYKSLKYLNSKMRTGKEIRHYLEKYAFEDSAIGYAIDRLKAEGILNDKRYVEAYVNDAMLLSLDGPNKIKVNLGKLGISNSLVEPVLDKIEKSTWESRVLKYVEKRAKINRDSEKMFKNKVISGLLVLGYPLELAKPIVDDYKIDFEDAFIKEATRFYTKLESKYSGSELDMRFRSKMFSKGYETDMINGFLNKKKDIS